MVKFVVELVWWWGSLGCSRYCVLLCVGLWSMESPTSPLPLPCHRQHAARLRMAVSARSSPVGRNRSRCLRHPPACDPSSQQRDEVYGKNDEARALAGGPVVEALLSVTCRCNSFDQRSPAWWRWLCVSGQHCALCGGAYYTPTHAAARDIKVNLEPLNLKSKQVVFFPLNDNFHTHWSAHVPPPSATTGPRCAGGCWRSCGTRTCSCSTIR